MKGMFDNSSISFVSRIFSTCVDCEYEGYSVVLPHMMYHLRREWRVSKNLNKCLYCMPKIIVNFSTETVRTIIKFLSGQLVLN
jgi:nitrate reductase cytochrome c-type subunit